MTAYCTCCVVPGLGRRALFGLAAAATISRPVRAAEDTTYDSMVLSCIDPRLLDPVHDWMAKRGLKGQYSQFIIAGGAVGVVAPKFAGWRTTFWDNLAITMQLHSIHRIIAIDHRDCGAVKAAYGANAIPTRQAETEKHREVFHNFRGIIGKRYPKLVVETNLMSLDGTVELLP
jgi:carbonic anhydrase